MEQVFSSALKNEACQTEIAPFSIYKGAPLKPNEKSISLRFTFFLQDGTLSGSQIESLQGKVIEVAKQNDYHLRG